MLLTYSLNLTVYNTKRGVGAYFFNGALGAEDGGKNHVLDGMRLVDVDDGAGDGAGDGCSNRNPHPCGQAPSKTSIFRIFPWHWGQPTIVTGVNMALLLSILNYIYFQLLYNKKFVFVDVKPSLIYCI